MHSNVNRAGYCLKIFNTGTDTFNSIPVPEQYVFCINFYIIESNKKKTIKNYIANYIIFQNFGLIFLF